MTKVIGFLCTVVLSLLREGYNKIHFNVCQAMLKLFVKRSRDFSWNNANVRDNVKTKGGEGGE